MSPRRRWTRLARDTRGVALIEFAITAPVLLLLFIGGFQLLDAIAAQRKVGMTARTLADLSTQNASLTTAGADTILNAARQVMTPYSSNNALLRITEVQVSVAQVPTVVWSRARNGTAYTPGVYIDIPVYLRQAGTWLIVAEVNYNYTPNVASRIIGSIPFTDRIYMSPRMSESIPCCS